MDIPDNVISSVVTEGGLFFFTSGCPFGIQDHIHVCIKKHKRILFFSVCSSQIDTAFRLASINKLDLDTFPVFTKNNVNNFTKEQTYIDCNNVIEISESDFGRLVQSGKIRFMNGHIDDLGLRIIDTFASPPRNRQCRWQRRR